MSPLVTGVSKCVVIFTSTSNRFSVPSVPIITLGTGISDGASFTEASQDSGVVIITAELGSTVTITFTGTSGSVSKTVIGNSLTPVSVVLTPANVSTLGEGIVSVSAVASNSAGSSPTATSSFTLNYSRDPYLANVSLLLHGNSSTGSRNIVDSSPNNFTVSTVGISYISTDQSKFEGSSIYLGFVSPTGSALSIPHNNAFEFGTGDFTIEFYIYITLIGGGETFTIYNKGGGIDISGDSSSGGRLFTLFRDNSDNFIFGNATGQEILTNLGSQANAWHHYALSRSGNNFYIFWDGVLRQSFTSSASIKSNTSNVAIDGTKICYIDEFRITKGVARYTSAFTVPNSQFQGVSYPLILTDRHYFPPNQSNTVAFRFPEPPVGFDINSVSTSGGTLSSLSAVNSKLYTATFTPTSIATNATASITVGVGSYYDPFGSANISKSESFTINSSLSESKGTTILLHMDGSNNSTTFTDSSPYGLTFVAVQNAKLSTTQSKFGGTSGAFLTSGDYVYTSDISGITFDSNNFTIEAWIYPLNPTSNVFGTERAICGMWNAVSPSAQAWILYLDSGKLNFLANYPDDLIIFSIEGVITEERWYHVAVTRSGTTMYCFIDGHLQATYNAGTGTINTFTNTFGVGGYNRSSGGVATFYGYIDDLRISKGICRYTKDFIPSLQAFTNPSPLTEFEQYVSLLLHMDGSNGSTTFTDSGPNALSVTPLGNSQISTSRSKFGGASGLFDGNGDYLSIPSNSVFNFGTGDFTVESWVYITSIASDFLLISSSGSGGFFIGAYNTTGAGWGVGRAAVAWDFTSGVSPVLNTWQHIAVSRSGTSLRIFVDGIQAGATSSNSRSYNLSTTSLNIASQGAAYYLTGNIDELRVSKGIARYTANFTPPSAPFPDS